MELYCSRIFVFVLVVSSRCSARSAPNPAKFLIVSRPSSGQISYMKVTNGLSRSGDGKMKVLIDKGLMHPQGIAVDQRRGLLIVADPEAGKVYSYELVANLDRLTVGSQSTLAAGVEARWVAVDDAGDALLSSEPNSQILRMSKLRSMRGQTDPKVIYDGSQFSISAPGGLAVDNFHTFWTNKKSGEQVGSVVQAPTAPGTDPSQGRAVVLTKSSDKSYGLCLALDNVYYTQPSSTILGVKKGGSLPVTVSDRLKNPRGCAWDGEGTVYVADRGANAVYSFAGIMQELGAAQLTKTVDVDDAFGVAVYSLSFRSRLYTIFSPILFFAVVGANLAAL